MQRAGLPLYPEEICRRVFTGNQENLNVGTLTNEATHHDDLSQTDNNFVAPDVDFRNFKLRRDVLYEPSIFEMPENSVVEQNPDPSRGYILLPMVHPSKQLPESDMMHTSLGSAAVFDQYGNHTYENTSDPPKLYGNYTCENNSDSSLCDPVLSVSYQFHGDNLVGSHATNGNNSSSSAAVSGATKLELPSLQYFETQQGGWGRPAPQLPSLESVDTLISPPVELTTQSDPVSPESSGLLESIIYHSKSLKVSNVDLQDTVPVETDKNLASNPAKTEWNEQLETHSPLGQSTSDYTPIRMCLVDEPQSVETG